MTLLSYVKLPLVKHTGDPADFAQILLTQEVSGVSHGVGPQTVTNQVNRVERQLGTHPQGCHHVGYGGAHHLSVGGRLSVLEALCTT